MSTSEAAAEAFRRALKATETTNEPYPALLARDLTATLTDAGLPPSEHGGIRGAVLLLVGLWRGERQRADETEAKLAQLREHTLDSNPALRTLHSHAVAYLDAVAALSEVRDGAPLSTTLGWLIRQGYLVPAGDRS